MKLSKRFFCLYRFAIVVFLTCTAIISSAATEKVLHSFVPYPSGYNPQGGMVRDGAGNLYGVAPAGGAYGNGAVFELQPNSRGGWSKKIIYNFTATDGLVPNPVILDRAGNLYGATYEGASGVRGANVFKLTPNARAEWTETIIYTFSFDHNPIGSLVFDSAGNLYGVTLTGGSYGWGTAFELTPSTSGMWIHTVLHDFDAFPGDGVEPQNGLTVDSAGNLYGSTRRGGGIGDCDNGGCGTVFELFPGGTAQWTETVLWRFGGNSLSSSGVVIDSTGILYGETYADPSHPGRNGSVYKLAQQNGRWQATNIDTFSAVDAQYPMAALVSDSAGNFYGASTGGSYGEAAVFELSPGSGGQWTEKLIYSFPSSKYAIFDSYYGVCSRLSLDDMGNLYGERTSGGVYGYGIVFELSPSASGDWTEKDLFTFSGGAGGSYPIGGLVFDKVGNLYGAALVNSTWRGVIFELRPSPDGSWSESVIHTFAGYPTDGSEPGGGLIFDETGSLYGTTYAGGSQAGCGFSGTGCGTVFRLSPASGGSWTETVIHSFSDANGAKPNPDLIFDASGNLYGTTQEGGGYCSNALPPGCGTVFELSPVTGGGWTGSVLHSFTDEDDGGYPQSGLLLDQSGNLYGTTSSPCSGYIYPFVGCGNVYELSPSGPGTWRETVLHRFEPFSTDASKPYGSLVMGLDGALYGTTMIGGDANAGSIFEVIP